MAIEEYELELAKLIRNFRFRGATDPGFEAAKLDKILYFSESERVAILVLSLEELRTEIRELRRELEAERANRHRESGSTAPLAVAWIGSTAGAPHCSRSRCNARATWRATC